MQIKKYNIIQFFICFVIIFNFAFPKGGIKVNDIPITIGLISLLILLSLAGISSLLRFKLHKIKNDRLKILLAWIPFQIWMVAVINENGYESLGMVFSLILNFFVMPWLCLFFNGQNFDDYVKKDVFLHVLNMCLWFVIIFGLINHGYKMITDNYIEIPFLTVNYDDMGKIYDKDNGRGVFGKLISTYQNGNLFGASMLLLLPLFCYLNKKIWHRLLFEVTLFLTLSRTIWLGIIFFEIFNNLGRKIHIKKLLYLNIIILIFILAVMYVIDWLGLDVSFIFDLSMGGRLNQENQSTSIDYLFVPTSSFVSISEIVYKGVLESFGYIGLLLFCMGFFSPLAIYYKVLAEKNTLKYSLMLGLLVYYFICLGDGGIMLIPVMIIYWTIVLLLTNGLSN